MKKVKVKEASPTLSPPKEEKKETPKEEKKEKKTKAVPKCSTAGNGGAIDNSEPPDCLVLSGDCVKWLNRLPEAGVHLTITDPPYASMDRHRSRGTTTRLSTSKSSSNTWFESFPNDRYNELFKALWRIHKKDTHCYMFCDSETEHIILSGVNPFLGETYFDDKGMSPSRSAGFKPWPSLIWVKVKDAKEKISEDNVSMGMGYHWRRSEDRILFLERGKRNLNHLEWPNVLVGERARRKDFPSQKPVSVIDRLILNSSEEGEIILDPFSGSGQISVAAYHLKRRSVAIEKDPIAARSIKQKLENLGAKVEFREN